MITNFEEITKELTETEIKKVIPLMINGLKTKIGKSKVITNKEMIEGLKQFGVKTSSPRVRKLIQAIRLTGSVERLIATSKGYYISNDVNELETYIESLNQRANSILLLSKQLEFQKNKIK